MTVSINSHILNFTRLEGGGCIVIRRQPIAQCDLICDCLYHGSVFKYAIRPIFLLEPGSLHYNQRMMPCFYYVLKDVDNSHFFIY